MFTEHPLREVFPLNVRPAAISRLPLFKSLQTLSAYTRHLSFVAFGKT